MTDQQMSATIYKGLFTETEWIVIDRALSEYQDHLGEDDNEERAYYAICDKISAIFKLAKWESFSSPLLLSLVLILASNC